MDAQETLKKIEELTKTYNQTSRRQTLTILRQTVTRTLRTTPVLRNRIEDIFNNNRLSMNIL